MTKEIEVQIKSQKRLIESIEEEILNCDPGTAVWMFWTNWRQREYNILREMKAEITENG